MVHILVCKFWSYADDELNLLPTLFDKYVCDNKLQLLRLLCYHGCFGSSAFLIGVSI